MAYENITQVKTKKIKRPLSESFSEREHETNENFYQFIVLESIEETLITKLSPIPDSKNNRNTLSTNQYQKSYEHHYYTNNKSEKIIGKNTKNIPSPNPKLLERSYKIPRPHLKPQGVTDVRRISICKETRIIDTNTYILTFNKPTTPTSIRKGYINTKIENCIPNPLRCQKYGPPKDKCSRPPICAKSSHTGLECQNPFNCINCTRNHPAYSWEHEMWKKKKELQK